jgi:hypothetical protein
MRNSSIPFGLLAFLAAAGVAAADDRPVATDSMGALSRFAGEWETHGKWSTGEELRARGTYEWGLGKKILKAQTFVMNGDKEYQRYESILAWHPKKKTLFEISFAYNGEISEVIVERMDPDTFHIGWVPFAEGQPANVRQTIHFEGDDRFVWTVQLKSADGWKQLIETTWRRKGT